MLKITLIFFIQQNTLQIILKKKKLFFDIIVLIQPTSPLLKKKQVNKLLKDFILNYKKYSSFQTVHETPHNYHYLNSRVFDKKNNVYFKFKKERKNKTNKQSKIKTFSFGNLIACKTSSLLASKDFFPQPCKPILIDRLSSFDLDNKEDLKIFKKIYETN